MSNQIAVNGDNLIIGSSTHTPPPAPAGKLSSVIDDEFMELDAPFPAPTSSAPIFFAVRSISSAQSEELDTIAPLPAERWLEPKRTAPAHQSPRLQLLSLPETNLMPRTLPGHLPRALPRSWELPQHERQHPQQVDSGH